jgi:Uma2 family endonuclease
MLSSMFDPSLVAPETIRPIARREFDRMVELGLFENERVELLRGALVVMSPQSWQHATTIQWLNEQFVRGIDASLVVRPQLPYAADEWSEPEPDLAIVRRDPALRDHPHEALLVIEVAATSLRKDRLLKTGIYAAAGVPEYWIVNLEEMVVEVHTRPSGDRYTHVEVLRDGDVLRPLSVPGIALAVADIPR